MTLPTKRAFLTAAGLAQGDRGRFSAEAEAHAAANADKWQAAPKAAPAARKPVVAAAPRPAPAPKVSSEGLNGKEVRTWAKAQGMEVGARGRMPADVISAYLSAHGKARPTGQAANRPQAVLTPKVRRESTGYAVERGTLLAFQTCAAKGGCGKSVNRCTCSTGPVAPHYLDAGIAGSPLLLVKPAL